MNQSAEETLNRTLSPHEQMDFAGMEHYFRVGRSALDCIQEGLKAAGRTEAGASPFGVETILDLPCGQGRVIRWLRMGFPNAEITACDMSREGVDFCASTFDAVPVYSCDDPEDIPVRAGHYDLVWVGSLFTHLEGPKWVRFLRAFHAALRPGGVLIFTTHGRRAHEFMATRAFHYGHDDAALAELASAYDRDRFGYVRYPGTEWHYGTSVSHVDWVLDQIRAVEGLTFVQHGDAAWDAHQDCFVCRRDA
ncbi:class I SAM-dependent methyltransferase [Planctomyces sp. SH-PL62]|uniref:class I SAM-dependent methyltransferase n=1 Tax=Planctomyces sp. SH-PL62 TaxID=1636152 RepID=UPI00078CD731|nr:class I SAM-dependent methyltransferase [Planctomyces sp. SH-PL62]AMV39444.1 biotin biosynthesis protein BioC [Planctomyces sp. SH-PL62]